MKHNLILSAALLWSALGSTFAITYTLDATSRGRYQNNGGRVTGNYIAGNAGSNEYYRDYFVFALSSIPSSETITSATLQLLNPSNGYNSADATETYTNFSLDSTSISSLTSGNGSNALNLPIYTDLGDGTSYSSGVMVSAASNGTVVQISLNNSFLGYAQANLGSSVALGGSVTTFDGNDNNNESIFGATGSTLSDTQLVIDTVPEPTTIGLFAFSAIIMAAIRRNRCLTMRCSEHSGRVTCSALALLDAEHAPHPTRR